MTSNVPKDLTYTPEHEWIKVEGRRARIGITDFAQAQLTDVVYVELPEPGQSLKAGEALGVVESVKSVSDVYAPAACTVVEVNDALEEHPELVNQDPYGKGWMFVVELSDPSDIQRLLDADAYRQHIEVAH